MFNVYYFRNPRYSSGKEIVIKCETENEAHVLCSSFNQDGGYEDENGVLHYVDYEEV